MDAIYGLWIPLAVFVVLVAAACGGASVEEKVGKRYGDVSSCRAVGKTELGKLYSCQADGTTVCVSIDGDDVFSATAEAARVGIAC